MTRRGSAADRAARYRSRRTTAMLVRTFLGVNMRGPRIAIITSLLWALLSVPAWAQDGEGEPEGATIEDEDAGAPAEEPGEPAPPEVPDDPPPAASKSKSAGSGDLLDELDDVGQELARARDAVYVAKARMLLLEAKIVEGAGEGAKISLVHVNKLGSAYRIASISYFFDGTPIFQGGGDDFSDKQEMKIFEGNVAPGNHTISVNITIEGAGDGSGSYLDDYSFKGEESHTLTAATGKISVLRTNLLRRDAMGPGEGPAIEFDLETTEQD